MTSSANSPSLALDARGLCRRYGRRWALAEVSLTLAGGKILMISGRNGSGKSTLLRVLSTAIRADRGEARLCGFDFRHQREEVRRRVALLGHDSYLYQALSALENLQVAARFLGRDARRAALLGHLEEVRLAHRADDPVHTFSAGMRKRLALARTLLQEATVVMLDEPFGQLDPQGFQLVESILERLKATGRTVLLATHLLERGRQLCDEAIVLEEGRLVWSGAAARLPDAARPERTGADA